MLKYVNLMKILRFKKNSMTSNWKWYVRDFWKFFVWSSINHFKDNFKKNYFIFKPNYFISFLILTFFLMNFLNNYFLPFLINISTL
jgi:hypothetical protein